jgi:TonB family protein
MAVPGGTVQDAVRELSRSASKGVSGSDTFDLGSGSGLNVPPSPGRPRIDYDLKTDPQGVDFRPYVLQVLAIVRRNWFAVYPESAKLGTRGQVKIEFAIAKDGTVNKVAWGFQSGTQALDRAAVAAISASNPLPALPSDYHGERIVLAFTFSYNMGR